LEDDATPLAMAGARVVTMDAGALATTAGTTAAGVACKVSKLAHLKNNLKVNIPIWIR
jgi:hypothetical protein